MARRPQHMHTVPAGYLRAFADTCVDRRHPNVWRFERANDKKKLISVRDASVSRGIYALHTEDGTPDNTIETRLLDDVVENPCMPVVRLMSAGGSPDYWQWRDLLRFIAFQLARTPRSFQLVRDEAKKRNVSLSLNDPQLAMVYIAPFLEKWICEMKWTIGWNGTTVPLLTSDNPVVTWADRGEGAEIGVGFRDPALQILFPLTPTLCMKGQHTRQSLQSAQRDRPSDAPQFTDSHYLTIARSGLGIEEIVKLNQVTVSNAERYIYAPSDDERILLFLSECFFGRSGPVRRSDRKSIGSETDPELSF